MTYEKLREFLLASGFERFFEVSIEAIYNYYYDDGDELSIHIDKGREERHHSINMILKEVRGSVTKTVRKIKVYNELNDGSSLTNSFEEGYKYVYDYLTGE